MVERIVIVTCRRWPELSVSDELLARELVRRGHEVEARAWNGTPLERFTSADLVVFRSNWDFHHDVVAFDEWLSAIEGSHAALHNPAGLVRTHNHKSYLQRLAGLGMPTPATLALGRPDAAVIRSWMGARGLSSVVLKPAWGASGHDVEHVAASDLDAARIRWEARPDRRGVIVQEFVPQIRSGELALVFFANQFSHALLRQPAGTDFRVNTQYGGTMALASRVDPAALALANRVLASLAEVPTYARIDVVGSGEEVTLMEVEVNEPALGLDLAPGSAALFADALLRS